VHRGTSNNSGSSSSLARTHLLKCSSQIFAETTALTVSAHLALFPILFDIEGDSTSFMGGWLGHFLHHQCSLIVICGRVQWDTVVNPFSDNLFGFVAQDWITARAFIVPVTPAINHAGSTRVSVPGWRTSLKDIEPAGCLPVISATAEELILWSFIFMASSAWRAAFPRHDLHLFCCAPITITHLVRTVLSPRRYGVRRRCACLVELSSPGVVRASAST